MRVKTFTGKTEEEALLKAKAELGEDAVVLNMKTINKKGAFSFFKNTRVEIMAAVDANQPKNTKASQIDSSVQVKPKPQEKVKETIEETKVFEEKINKLQNQSRENEAQREKDQIIAELNSKLRKSDELITTLTKDILQLNDSKSDDFSGITSGKFENKYKQEVYKLLLDQNVLEPIAFSILNEINDNIITSLDICKRLVYKKIVDIIGEPELININLYAREREKVVFFIGPTGVGKTTTIAKLASKFILEENLVMGLITSDTYRIAAVEQLKIYAEILGIDLNVVYNKNDIISAYNNMISNKDLIFVDTAGRSHKNQENIDELIELMSVVSENDVYLVLSLTTKSDDLIDIIQTYSNHFDFKILFTKADETISLGPILNVCYITNKKISYITNGQTVPNDVYRLEPESVAKSILGIEVI